MRARVMATAEQGQALVEFALVLPLLLLVLFGIAQFGLAYNVTNDDTHLANEIARFAAVNENPGEGSSQTLQSWGKAQADQYALQHGATICISFPNGSEIGAPVRVEMRNAVKWLPIVPGAEMTVSGVAYMRIEGPPSRYSAGCA
ncbi:MAG: pilus assembly protein [Solirubrobacterales bacterium]|jgi:Flp pilus assembly protein TadG|nr:pilus assembly protein [Solirubrobacterales bacterium]